MTDIDFIHDRDSFVQLWQRANSCVQSSASARPSELLHFDSSNIAALKFLGLIRKILAFNGAGEFALIVLDPDPFNYFQFHFEKYPGFIVKAEHSDDQFFRMLFADPGGSPADAIGHNSERYMILPLPGDWFVYGDRAKGGGTGLLSGPPDLMAYARTSFHFYENPT